MRDWTRRTLVQAAGIALASPGLTQASAPRFSFQHVLDRAEDLSSKAYDDESVTLPSLLAGLDYDSYRELRYRPEVRVDLGGGFSLDLFHRGHVFKQRTQVNIVRDGIARSLPYLSNHFDFGGQALGPYPVDFGFAGLRIRFPLNQPSVDDELMVFLGASYFRFLARGQRFGLSARGLAVNAAVPGLLEEFPYFREFWVEADGTEQDQLNLFALLDSPSVTGAFSFTLVPGQTTYTDVRAIIIPRVDLASVGIAPLTSMYLTGSNGSVHTDLFRREVHDSDGLLIKHDDRTI